MLISILKSKLHMATVTSTVLRYNGSIGIDADLMDAVRILPYERVLVSNMRNGNRFETYVIPEQPGSGKIVLYGPAARLSKKGDRLVIFAFALAPEEEARSRRPLILALDKKNKPAGPLKET